MFRSLPPITAKLLFSDFWLLFFLALLVELMRLEFDWKTAEEMPFLPLVMDAICNELMAARISPLELVAIEFSTVLSWTEDFSVLSLGWKSPARQKMRHKMTSHGGDVSQSRRTQGGKYADKVTVVRPSSNELEKR